MARSKGLKSVISQLRDERTNLVDQLRHVDAALSVLGKLDGGRYYTEHRRTVSASARRRMSLAQKARWAKKQTSDQAGAKRPRRTMSSRCTQKDRYCQAEMVGQQKGDYLILVYYEAPRFQCS